jgi:transposase-like protein
MQTCPNCGSEDSSKVRMSFWGAAGPLWLKSRECKDCNIHYSEKTGNLVNQWDYAKVSLKGVAIVVIGLLGILLPAKLIGII